jgi:hypothetical protein
MELSTAKAILEEAIEGGYLEEMPTHDLIEQGEFYFQHAQGAVEDGNADDCIEKIVAIGTAPEAGLEPEADEEKPAKAEVTKENLPIPRQIEGDPPVMPRDTSELNDKEVRRLMGEFNACLGRAVWLIQDALDDELRIKQLKENAYRTAYLAEEEAARENSVKLTKEALDFAARESEEFQEYDQQLFEASKLVRNYKALKEIYQGNIDRLSREGTLRDDEARRDGRRK